MDTPPFFVDLLCNGTSFTNALVDSGCCCHAIVSESYATSLRTPRINIKPRILREAATKQRTIRHLTYLTVDVGGYAHRIWAYVVPQLNQQVILGKGWMQKNGVVHDAAAHRLAIGKADGMTIWEYGYEPSNERTRSIAEAKQVSAYVMDAMSRRRRRRTPGTSVFSVTIHDINKALAPKKVLTNEEVKALLPTQYHEWLTVFLPDEGTKLPPHREGADHAINLTKDAQGNDAQVPWGPLYGMTRDELLVLRKTLTELLDAGYIRASSSPAGAPVLFVKKSGGGLRFCVDYRRLNALTVADRYPLPLIKETMSNLTNARWFTKLDVRAAFYKLRIKEGDEWKTAMRTRFGLFEWLVTPFGLAGAPATFQRYVNSILRPHLDVCCTAYLDDILIYTDGTKDDHEAKVKQILSLLEAAGLYLDINKCEFAVKTTRYLGFIITAGVGVSMDPEKVKAIQDWEPPTTVRGVRGFLGFANFYRHFIKDFTEVVEPLLRLTKKTSTFEWGSEQEAAFEKLKLLFLREPCLAQWDPDRDTVVEADCSGYALGGCLSQRNEHGILLPVAHYSRRLTAAECNYEIHDKELLAVISCLRAWEPELKSTANPFIILTDHKNLSHFMTKKRLSERQVRWSDTMEEYRFRLHYREGARHERPDALSRRDQDRPRGLTDERYTGRFRQLLREEWLSSSFPRPDADTEAPKPETTALPIVIRDVVLPAGNEVFADEELQRLWEAALEYDRAYPTLHAAVKGNARALPPNLRYNGDPLKVAVTDCTVDQDGLLRFRGRTWIPEWEPLQTRLIQRVHDSRLTGHPGRDQTYGLLSRDYFWPKMQGMVRRFVRNCDTCGRKNIWRHRTKGLLRPLPVPERFWSELSIDFETDLPQKNPDRDPAYLMVITDRLSKAIHLEAMYTMEAEACAERFIQCHWRYHGFPAAITSDRGANWVGRFWTRLCELTRIEQRLSTAYHPQTDGSTERANQEVQAYIRAFAALAQYDWVEQLPAAMLALNNRDSTVTGISPFFAQHGFHVSPIEEIKKSPVPERDPRAAAERFIQRLKDATDLAQVAMAAAQQSMEDAANKKRSPAERFAEGDLVWLSLKNMTPEGPSRKFSWLHAKYRITKIISPHVVELNVPRGVHNKFHVDLLMRAATDPLPSQDVTDHQPPPLLEGPTPEESEWLVERILEAAKKKRRGRGAPIDMVKVKWVGYDEPTWEPRYNFQETEALERFENGSGATT